MRKIKVWFCTGIIVCSLLVQNTEAGSCQEDYERFLEAKNVIHNDQQELWATKMADASASWPWDGMTEGGNENLGSYYSCLEMDSQDGSANDDPFLGQYCLVRHHISLRGISIGLPDDDSDSIPGMFEYGSRGLLKPMYSNKTLFHPFAQQSLRGSTLGLCVPSSCSEEEIQTIILDSITDTHYGPLVSVDNQFSIKHCQIEEDKPELTPGDKIFISLLAIFGALIAAGTILDFLMYQQPSTFTDNKSSVGYQLLTSFSMYTNTKKLLDTSGSKRPELIPCLDGIRFLSMTWVVILHTYDYSTTTPLFTVINRNDIHDVIDSFLLRAVFNPILSVDSFFVLSGCLLAYITFKEMDRSEGKINLLLFYLHRYIRLTGVYAVVVAFYATLYKFFDYGILTTVDFVVEQCQNNWWRNLLYINNLAIADENTTCLGQTWYMAADMQIFVFTPLLLFPMWHLHKRWGFKASLGCCFAFLAASWIWIMSLSIANGWTSNAILSNDPGECYLCDYYPMSWTRCSPYIIGMGLGFILHKTKKKIIKINKFIVILLWATAFAMGIAVTFGEDSVSYYLEGTEPKEWVNVLYNTFARSAWGFALSWLIFACFHGYGGFVNAFLSWEAFGPLGKMAFNVYLIHYPLIRLIMAQYTYPVVVTNLLTVFTILFTLAICLTVSFFLTIFFELPIISCDKIILGYIFSGRKQNEK